MRNYIFLLLAALSLTVAAQTHKLSPNLRVAMERRHHSGKKSAAAQDQQLRMFRATLVATSAEQAVDALSQLDIEAVQITPTTLTATLSENAVEEVAALPCIKSIELGAPAQPCLSLSRSDIGMDRVHNANPKFNALGQAYTGRGVVVGVIDAGFEYGHAAFRRPDGTLRISRVWEQLTAYGRTPGMFNYGTELRTPTEILNARTDSNGGTHGTHVAGCAAGSDPTAEQFQGMAPDAELVLVAVSGTTTSTYILDAVKYIFDYADEVQKPCVINISLGSHYGPHDGTSTLDQAYDALTGPGRIIVGAAGNEGDYRLHVSKTFSAAEPELRTTYGFTSEMQMESLIDIWGDPQQTYSVSLIVADNLKGQVHYQSSAISSNATESLHLELVNAEHGATGYIDLTPRADNPNGRQNIYVETHLSAKLPNRTLGLVITGPEGTTVHAWNCSLNDFVSNSRAGFTAGDTQSTIGEIGGTGRSVISVGAYQLRGSFTNMMGEQMVLPGFGKVGDMAYFSSQGPTLDGRMKPDVCAPGVSICGPVSKIYYGSDARYQMEYLSDGPDHDLFYYYPMSGTSMSSPIVAGSVACWLEANPELTPDQIREIISQTARHDEYTPLATSNLYGYGKFDAYAGILRAVDYANGIDAPQLSPLSPSASYDLQGRAYVRQPQSGIYLQQGRKVMNRAK